MRPITPSLPRTAQGVLLVGGTFDPPHRAHIELPRRVRDTLVGRHWHLVYIPTARNPLKSQGPIATDEQRLAMLARATHRVPRCHLWPIELDAPTTPTYWIDTLTRARAALSKSLDLRFILGSDSAATFHLWRQPREILALADPIVLLRPPHTTTAKLIHAMRKAKFWTKPELDWWQTRIAEDLEQLPTAATDLREKLAKNMPPAKDDLAPAVARYIKQNSLYRAARIEASSRKPITFNTTIAPAALAATAEIVLPFDPKARFGTVRQPVRVTINGHTYASTIFRMNGIHFVPLRKSHRLAASVTPGHTYSVTLTPDRAPRTVTVPINLARALRAAGLTQRFNALSYTHRREHIEAIETAKKPETKARRIAACLTALAKRSM